MTDWLTANPTERDVLFLRSYAQKIRDGKEREIDIPSIIANIFEDMANRIEGRNALHVGRVIIGKGVAVDVANGTVEERITYRLDTIKLDGETRTCGCGITRVSLAPEGWATIGTVRCARCGEELR